MTAKLSSWWQKIKKPLKIIGTIIVLILLAVLIILIVQGYRLNWDWVGLGPYTTPAHPKDTDFQRGKTLWDWLQLLIIPLVLAVGALLFNLATTRTEQKIAAKRYKQDQHISLDKQREDLLQTYLDRMSELLKEKLRSPEADAEVRNVARVYTLTVLSRLDANRKASVLQFLYESDLIGSLKSKPIIDLKGADLSRANLSGTYLRGAYLSRVNLNGAKLERADLNKASLLIANLSKAKLSEARLSEAKLRDADLRGAKLNGADLVGVDLYEAKLNGANLSRANLNGAKLNGADLSEADLSEADLSRAKLNGANLSEANLKGATGMTIGELEKQAKSLQSTTRPDGSKHP